MYGDYSIAPLATQITLQSAILGLRERGYPAFTFSANPAHPVAKVVALVGSTTKSHNLYTIRLGRRRP